MGFPILVRCHLYIESVSRAHFSVCFGSNQAMYFERYKSCVGNVLSVAIFNTVLRHGHANSSPGPCIYMYYSDLMLSKNFSQCQRRFQWKLRSNWLKFLLQRSVAIVIQDPGLPFLTSSSGFDAGENDRPGAEWGRRDRHCWHHVGHVVGGTGGCVSFGSDFKRFHADRNPYVEPHHVCTNPWSQKNPS